MSSSRRDPNNENTEDLVSRLSTSSYKELDFMASQMTHENLTKTLVHVMFSETKRLSEIISMWEKSTLEQNNSKQDDAVTFLHSLWVKKPSLQIQGDIVFFFSCKSMCVSIRNMTKVELMCILKLVESGAFESMSANEMGTEMIMRKFRYNELFDSLLDRAFIMVHYAVTVVKIQLLRRNHIVSAVESVVNEFKKDRDANDSKGGANRPGSPEDIKTLQTLRNYLENRNFDPAYISNIYAKVKEQKANMNRKKTPFPPIKEESNNNESAYH